MGGATINQTVTVHVYADGGLQLQIETPENRNWGFQTWATTTVQELRQAIDIAESEATKDGPGYFDYEAQPAPRDLIEADMRKLAHRHRMELRDLLAVMNAGDAE